MIEYRTDYRPTNDELNALNNASWDNETFERDYTKVWEQSLGHVCALDGEKMVGFVNIAWDGGIHAFILDTCVAPKFRHRGIASKLIEHSIRLAKDAGAPWLHVDFDPHLEAFYQGCGFRPSKAGLIDLTD